MGGTRERGFALIIVISVLTIVSSLIVGFALLSNLENKKIDNAFHSPMLIAKRNALCALHEALAKLQATSGQDTVATAKADILGTAVEGSKNWVGVWKVNKCDERVVTDRDQKTFLAWLVSGNYYDETDCNTAIETVKRISIINPKYTNIEPVYVTLVDSPDTTNGRGQYAYWIDDHSLKIQGNIYDTGNLFKDLFTTSSQTSSYYWYTKKQCQGKYGLSMVPDFANCPLTQAFLSGHKEIQSEPSATNFLEYSALSEQQYQYMQGHFHDLTNLSLGLLTDTRNGGFRKNLRYKETNYLSEVPDNAFIFQPPTTFPAPPTTWGYLKSFFNIDTANLTPRATYPLYRPQAGVNYRDCAMNCTTDADGYVTGEITGTNAGDLGIATRYGIYPIWTEFKNYIVLYCSRGYTPDNSSSSAGGRYQSLRMQPGFYFENPYTYAINSAMMKIWQCSPYVTNLELSSQSERYQKQPTFRCRIFYENPENKGENDGLYQNYPNSQNDDDKVFPFLSIDPDKHMRPVWDGTITTDYAHASPKYIHLNGHTSYIASGKVKSLTTHSSNNPTSYDINDIRFYQSPEYKDTIAGFCWMESHPPLSSSDWNGTWKNNTDQWSPLCLRTMDSSNNILQQICDVEMKYDSLNVDRNVTSDNLSKRIEQEIPLYLVCASLRKDSSTSSNYWHQYTTNSEGIRPLIEGDPRAPISCRTAHQDDMTSSTYSGNFIPGNWSWCAHWLGLSNGQANIYSHPEHIPFADYTEFRNLFDLPSKENKCKLFNLGFLQHMNVGPFSYHPSYAFGNSYQNPLIPRENFFQENAPIDGSTWPSHNRVEMLYDYSYCLNRILWDSYFIASTSSDSNIALLNHRQKAFSWAIDTHILSFQDAAENMAIHGAFNVNSTSKNAWIAFFASTIGNLSSSTTHAEYSRIQSLNETENVGMRQLDQPQIQALAEKIVDQIKKRGVAGSIGEFVNRKLITKSADTHQLGLKGALQAAIDGTTINNTYGGDVVTSKRNKTWFDDEAASGSFWACKPGYLTQADILQSTGTALCARGDTFSIYAYGNALDVNGAIEVEMRCEAIVQRLPELLDPAKPELGRKYKILAIKWITLPLNDNEKNKHIANHWLGITNAISRNNIGPVLADVAWDLYGQNNSSVWALTNIGEDLTLATYKFLQNLQSIGLTAAASKFAADLNSAYEGQSFFPTIAQNPILGEVFSKTLSGIQQIQDLFSGGSTSIADVRNTIVEAVLKGQSIIASDSTAKKDFDNTIAALHAMDEKTQKDDIYIANQTDNSNKDKLGSTFTDNLNGTAMNSDGAQLASLLTTLDSLEEALNAYQNAKQ
ncbi:MAG: hypothetical protein LBQ03_00850 [Puniceicoccales bacterium]|jgi:hypothetical protein|nr:hypothetical protein [Puniceicoccales bacterium]